MTEGRLANADIASLALIDESTVDWSRAREVSYFIHQHIRYEYPGPIADLRQRLVISPRDQHGDQQRVAQRLDVFPQMPATAHRDAFGNSVIALNVPKLDCGIDFEYWSLVERNTQAGEHRVPRAVLESASLYQASLLTMPDSALRDAADALAARHREPLELAHAINHFVYGAMEYAFGFTEVHTSAAAAFALRRGVCQDYAHIMLAMTRHCGIASRYVSGHLLGEGGTHAWLEVIVPDGEDALVVAFDPTHDRTATLKYIVVAVGRDYADVAPTSGVFTAPYNGELSVRKKVGVTAVAYAA